MGILLCVLIAWVTFCCLFMSLLLMVLRLAERVSGSSGAITADNEIEDRALRMADFDLSAPQCAPFLQAPELACDMDAPTQLETIAALERLDANAMTYGTVADVQEHTGAVIIRDPRLIQTRDLGGSSDPAEEALSSTEQRSFLLLARDEVLLADIKHQ